MLRFFRRRPAPAAPLATPSPATAASARALTVLSIDQPAAATAESCSLAACGTGARATVLALCCGDQEACRLRALGLCEGASVNVVDARHAMLLDVRGTRIALGRALTAGITVQPIAG